MAARPVSVLRIPYEAKAFPKGTIANGRAKLAVTWDDILWAAVTVGRPSRNYVFRHGAASMYEALFRLSLVRMALEQCGPLASRLRRTTAFKTLDPSEKGAVNYFLGMTFCKLFAYKLLNIPWLLHLDVYRPALNLVLKGRSRPDLVGQEQFTNRWHAFECKGRVSPPDKKTKTKAKTQAQRLVSVGSSPCALHVGAITYFRGDTLNFYWCDPPPEIAQGISVPDTGDVWMHYYAPIVDTFEMVAPGTLTQRQEALVELDGTDVKVGIHPNIAECLINRNWEQAHQSAKGKAQALAAEGYQPDGLKVVAGSSWTERFVEDTERGVG